MKILEITNLGYLNGGVETGLMLFKSEMERRGHEVKILTSNARPDLVHFGDREFEALEHKPRMLQLFYRIFYPEPYIVLKKFLKEFEPDIVHLHTISQISPSILFPLKKYRTIVTVNQVEDYTISILPWSFPQSFFKDGSYRREALTLQGKLHYFFHRFISRTMYHVGFRNVDCFIAVSRYMQECLKEDGIESVYISNATKLFDFSPIDAQSQNILFAGRLEQSKGLQTVIEAIPDIKAKFPRVQLWIAGRGAYQQDLERQVEQLHLGASVHFLGFQNRAELYDLYKRATVVVMPSIWPESFGNVGIEAMSVGRPVIATHIGGTSDWLSDGETGYFILPTDSDAVAQKIVTLFSNPALLERFSHNARAHALKFSIENHVTKILELFELK